MVVDADWRGAMINLLIVTRTLCVTGFYKKALWTVIILCEPS